VSPKVTFKVFKKFTAEYMKFAKGSRSAVFTTARRVFSFFTRNIFWGCHAEVQKLMRE